MKTFTPLPSVCESVLYFEQLVEWCNRTPPFKAANLLWEEFRKHEDLGFVALTDFVYSLEHYISQFSPLLQEEVLGTNGRTMGALVLFRSYRRYWALVPERWPNWGVWERDRLANRRTEVIRRMKQAEEEGRSHHVEEHRANLQRIDSILAAYDTAVAEGRAVLLASEVPGLPKYARRGGIIAQESTLGLSPKTMEKPAAERPRGKDISYRQIALLKFYWDEVVTRNNAAEIVAEFGKPLAGRLAEKYEQFCSDEQMNTPLNSKEAKYLVKDIESIYIYLNKSQQERAKSHAKTINKNKSTR